MTRLLRWMAEHPWPQLGIVLLGTLWAGTQLPRLHIDVSPQALTIEGDPARDFYRRSVAVFGSDNISILFFQDPDLFDPERLGAIRDLIGRVQALPFVSRTESLFSVPYLHTVDSYVHTAPYLENLPATAQEAQAIRAAALANPFVRNNLLSEDGTALAVNVYLEGGQSPRGFDEQVRAALARELAPLEGRFAQTFQLGLPSIRSAIGEKIRHDQVRIAPAAVAVLLLTLALTLRRPLGIFIPLLTASVSVVLTLGTMAALDIRVNVMTAMVPVLLIIVGSSENIHLLSEYYRQRAGGASKSAALRGMASAMGLAVLLTFATTYLGFLSIAANPIALLREFGLVASSALLCNFLVTVALVPALLGLTAGERPLAPRRRGEAAYGWVVAGIGELVMRRRRAVLLLSLAAAAAALFGMGGLRVDNNLLNYLSPQDPLRQKAEVMHRELAGVETFTVVVDGRIQGTFRQVRYLRELQKIQRYLSGTGQFDSNVSFADYVALLNSAANDSGRAELPDSDAELEDLLLFVKGRHVDGLVSPDYAQTTIVVRYRLESSDAMNRALEGLERYVGRSVDPGLGVRATGESVLSSRAADYITRGQVASLGFMLVAILALISLLFLNLRTGLLAVLVNVFPLLVLFGVMGYARIPLDTGTALIAAIAVGVCVNHTVHFMVRYHNELRRHSDEGQALRHSLQAEALPIMVTTATMGMGFTTLVLSSFTPVVYFGLLSALTMLSALFANLFIAPVLLASTRLLTLWDLISRELRGELTTRCPLFRSMTPRQIRRIFTHGRLFRFTHGEVVMRAGEPGQELFVLLRGQAQMHTTAAAGGPGPIRRLGQGDVFGVLAVVSETPRFATVAALEEVDLLALDLSRIERLARAHPSTTGLLYRNLMRILGDRFAQNASGAATPRAPDIDPRSGPLAAAADAALE